MPTKRFSISQRTPEEQAVHLAAESLASGTNQGRTGVDLVTYWLDKNTPYYRQRKEEEYQKEQERKNLLRSLPRMRQTALIRNGLKESPNLTATTRTGPYNFSTGQYEGQKSYNVGTPRTWWEERYGDLLPYTQSLSGSGLRGNALLEAAKEMAERTATTSQTIQEQKEQEQRNAEQGRANTNTAYTRARINSLLQGKDLTRDQFDSRVRQNYANRDQRKDKLQSELNSRQAEQVATAQQLYQMEDSEAKQQLQEQYRQQLAATQRAQAGLDYYNSAEGIRSRATTAQRELDQLRQVYTELSDRASIGAPTDDLPYHNVSQVRQLMDQKQSEYNDLRDQYYYRRNEEAQKEVKYNPESRAAYEVAETGSQNLNDLNTAIQYLSRNATRRFEDLPAEGQQAVQAVMDRYGYNFDGQLLQKLRNVRGQEYGTYAQGAEQLGQQGINYDMLKDYQTLPARAAQYQATTAAFQEAAHNNPILNSLYSVAVSPAQGVEGISALLRGAAADNSLDNYTPQNPYDMIFTNYVSTIRNTVSQDIADNTDWNLFGQNVASFLYQTGMSMADSATQVYSMGPAAVYFMGAGAAANQAKDLMDKGATNEQVFWGGLASGVAETLFEKVSLDRLLQPKAITNWKTLVKEVAAQAGVEGSEEMFTEIANILSDAAILKDHSDWAQNVAAYRLAGYSEDDANRLAFMDAVAQVAWAGAGGALSGAGMGGGVSALNFYYNSQAGQQGPAPIPQNNADQTTAPAPAPMDVQTQTQTPADLLTDAINRARNGETVSNSKAEAILADPDAVATLTQNGMQLTEGMTKSQQREAVKAGVLAMAQQQQAEPAPQQQTQERFPTTPPQEETVTPQQNIPQPADAAEALLTASDLAANGQAIPDSILSMIVSDADAMQAMQDSYGFDTTESMTPEDAIEEARRALYETYGTQAPSAQQTQTADQGAEEQQQSSALLQAASLAYEGQRIPTAMINEILSDEAARTSLQEDFGAQISDAMTAEQQQQAVRQALYQTYEQQMPDEMTEARAQQQEQQQRLDNQTIQLQRQQALIASDSLGRNGSRAFQQAYNDTTARQIGSAEAYRGFAAVYQSALTGQALTEEGRRAAALLPESMRYAAQQAGENDLTLSRRSRYWGADAGVVRDWGLRQSGLKSKDIRTLDTLGKAMGLRIQFRDKVYGPDGELVNGKIEDGVITVATSDADPVNTTVYHELVHRIRATSPLSYQALETFVRSNMGEEAYQAAAQQRAEDYGTTERGYISEELIADAFGRILSDGQSISDLVETDRTLGQKIADALRDMVNHVRNILSRRTELRLSADQVAEFQTLQGRLEDMRALFNNALAETMAVSATRTQEQQAALEQERAEAIEEEKRQQEQEQEQEQEVDENDTLLTDEQLAAAEYQATEEGQEEELSDINTRFSRRTKEPPKQTVKGYKVFLLRDGKLYPPMVANKNGTYTELGVWLDADAAKLAGKSATGRPQVEAGGRGTNSGKMTLSYRPGWHAGDTPFAAQFLKKDPISGREKSVMPYDFVWAEVELAADVDYQEKAESYGWNEDHTVFRHSLAGLPALPVDGYYTYRTNPNPRTVPWRISGAMMISRIMSDQEVYDHLRGENHRTVRREGGEMKLDNFFITNGTIEEVVEYQRQRTEQLKQQQREGLAKHGINPGELLTYDEALEKALSDGSLQTGDYTEENARDAQWNLYTPIYFLTNSKAKSAKMADGDRVTTSKETADRWAQETGQRVGYAAQCKIYSIAWTSAKEGYAIKTAEGEAHNNRKTAPKYIARTDSEGQAIPDKEGKVIWGTDAIDDEGRVQVVYAADSLQGQGADYSGFGPTYTTSGTGQRYYLDLRGALYNDNITITKGETEEIFKQFKDKEIYAAFGRNKLDNGKLERKADVVSRAADWVNGAEATDDLTAIKYFADKLGDLGRVITALKNGKRDSLIIQNDDGTTSYVDLRGGAQIPVEQIHQGTQAAQDAQQVIAGLEDQPRFSRKSAVEKKGQLIAVHNLTEANLQNALELGGLPSPSIAIIRANQGHSNFGPISLVFPSSAIDPQTDSRNRIYGADAYTPTVGSVGIDYTASDEAASRIHDKAEELRGLGDYGYLYADPLERYADIDTLQQELNYEGGWHGLVESLQNNEDLKRSYLYDIGYADPEEIDLDEVNQSEFNAWLDDLFRDTVATQELRTEESRKVLDDSGRIRIAGPHAELTLENLVTAMNDFGGMRSGKYTLSPSTETLQAITAPEYQNLSEVREDSGRLGAVPDVEYDQLVSSVNNRISDARQIVQNSSTTADDGTIDALIIEAASGPRTIDAIVSTFADGGVTISNTTAQALRDMYQAAAQLPTEYFESKPERAVSFAEVSAAVVPDNTRSSVVQALAQTGMRVLTYENGNDDARNRVLNSVDLEDLRFSRKRTTEDTQGRQLTEQQQSYFKDSKVRDNLGRLKVMYHGTPQAGFTRFRTGAYFTDNPEYAARYQDPGVSSLTGRKTGGNPGVYEAYLNIRKPFDTRRAKERRIFQNEFYRQWGTGAPLSERGLPDWNDGLDLQEFIEEMEYDYDGLILDEGGENDWQGNYISHGLSYVVFSPEQVKNVTNQTPTDDEDIRYSKQTDKEQPASPITQEEYEALKVQNDTLQKQIELYREGMKLSPDGKIPLVESDLKKIAQKLKSETYSTLGLDEILSRVRTVAQDVRWGYAQSTLDKDLSSLAKDLVDTALKDSYEDSQNDELESMKQDIAQFRKIVRGQKLEATDALKGDFAPKEYAEFRRKNFGLFRLVNPGKGGLQIDVFMDELAQQFPSLPIQTDLPSHRDMLENLASVANMFVRPDFTLWGGDVRHMYNPFAEWFPDANGVNWEAAYQAQAQEILSMVTNEQTLRNKPTAADKIAQRATGRQQRREQKLQSQIAKLREQMQKQRQDARQRQTDYEKQARQATRKLIRDAQLKERERYEKQLAKLKEQQRLRREREQERKADSEARQKLLRIVRRLSNMKLPYVNRQLLNQYIGDLDTVAVSLTGRNLQNLSNLRDAYNEAKKDKDFISDPAIEKRIERLSKRQIADLTQAEVADLTKVLLNMENEFRTMRHMIDSEERRDIYLAGLDVIDDIDRAKGSNNVLDRYVVTEALSPVRMMHRLTGYRDGDPLYRATLELQDGQRKMLEYQMKAERPFQRFAENKAFSRFFNGKNAEEITIEGRGRSGRETAVITPAMRVSLYLHSLNDQNLRHIKEGGITIPDIKLYKAGNIKEAYNKGKTLKLLPSEVRAITGMMTPEEQEFAAECRKYFNTTSRAAINATSERLKGYSLAETDEYFPINTDPSFTRSDFEALKMDGTIEGMGFLKERINASNPILLRDANSVLEQSIQMHGKYWGLAIPVRNFNKLWNVSQSTRDPITGELSRFETSVIQAIRKQWGDTGYRYVEKMMTDLQSGSEPKNEWSKLFADIRSRYAGAVLTLNFSVALKQAASYPTAAAVLGWRPLVRAMGNFGKVNTDQIEQYTPLQWYRSKGYSTRELGDLQSRQISLPVWANWIQDVDVWTTRKLWKASEYYVQQNHKDLDVGSRGYYETVADVYNRVIEETQPNYTTMQRPQLLRSNDNFLSNLQMFKTQPFQNFNILYEASANMLAKRSQHKSGEISQDELREAQQNFGRALTSQVAQLAVFAGMTMLWALMRKRDDKYRDKDGKLTAKTIGSALATDMGSGLASTVPFGSEAWEAVAALVSDDSFYSGLDVPIIEAITNTYDALTDMGDICTETARAVIDGQPVGWTAMGKSLVNDLKDISKVLGIPFENLYNLFDMGLAQTISLTEGERAGKYASLALRYDPIKDKTKFQQAMLDALDAGDYEGYQQMAEYMAEATAYKGDDGLPVEASAANMASRYKSAYIGDMLSALEQGNMESYQQMEDYLTEHTAVLGDEALTPVKIAEAVRSKYKTKQSKDPEYKIPEEAEIFIGLRLPGSPSEHTFSENDLDHDGQELFLQRKAEIKEAAVESLRKTSGFKKLDQEKQEDLINKAEDLAKGAALEEAANGEYYATKWIAWASNGRPYGVSQGEAILYRLAYEMSESDVDENGKTVSGSKREHTNEQARKFLPNLSDEELAYLEAIYWTPSDDDLKELKDNDFRRTK